MVHPYHLLCPKLSLLHDKCIFTLIYFIFTLSLPSIIISYCVLFLNNYNNNTNTYNNNNSNNNNNSSNEWGCAKMADEVEQKVDKFIIYLTQKRYDNPRRSVPVYPWAYFTFTFVFQSSTQFL